MKKTLLTILALMVAIVGVNAQKLATKGALDGRDTKYKLMQTPDAGMVKPSAKAMNRTATRIGLDADERIIGYFTSDEISKYYGSVSCPAQKCEIGTPIFSDVIGKAVGGQLTKARVQLYAPIGSSTISVYTISAEGRISTTPVTTGTISTTVAGWNDVTFDTPVTLNEGESLFITYDFVIETAGDEHNFLVDADLNETSSVGGIYMYGNYGQGFGLYSVYTNVNLCIQLVVKGGSYSDDDLVLTGGIDRTIAQRGKTLDVVLNLNNAGNNLPSSYTLDFQIDGSSIDKANTPVVLINNDVQQFTYRVNIPESLSKDEEHTLTVKVADINGKVPTENVDDDMFTASFNVFDEEDVVEKQKTLVEQFTSAGCPNCPYGYDFLDALTAKRNDLAWVSVHTDYGGVSDEYTTITGDNLVNLEVSVFPSASFNRALIFDADLNPYSSNAISIGITPQYVNSYVSMYSNMIDQINANVPAFASVDIATEYNEETRNLKIKVSGEGAQDVKKLLADGALTIYLTEDGLKGVQYYYPEGSEYADAYTDYPHDHVLRQIIGGNYGFGETINWTSNTTYSNEYEMTLPDEWNAKNMNVIAFIGKEVKIVSSSQGAYIDSAANDIWVSNANMVKLGETSTGISNAVVSDENAVEVARYALDGTKLSAPTKGVNIIKMSDGTTRKVVVNK